MAMSRKTFVWIFIGVIIIGCGVGMWALSRRYIQPSGVVQQHVLKVVAAENVWGSLVSQIGGNHVQVLSVVSDPNVDPHEYESNVQDARAFAEAAYVVENGAGYDAWADHVLNADQYSQRRVLNVATFLGKKPGDNPHLWYDPASVNQVIRRMRDDLIAIDPANTQDYQKNYQTLQGSLSAYQQGITVIKERFAGTKVASTEDIFVYVAQAAGLNLISPPAFMQAVAEGTDPPTSSVVAFQQALQASQAKLLVYNTQTVTALTESMKNLALSRQIPVIGVSEIIQPPEASFQTWMGGQVARIQQALQAKNP